MVTIGWLVGETERIAQEISEEVDGVTPAARDSLGSVAGPLQRGAIVEPAFLHDGGRLAEREGIEKWIPLCEDDVRNVSRRDSTEVRTLSGVVRRCGCAGTEDRIERYAGAPPEFYLLVKPDPRSDVDIVGVTPEEQVDPACAASAVLAADAP
ncbi:MAG: hypothetical protein M3541_02775 [Acidobacteriota bacterium]|nr:hypothetical protein [Acidobacteriota bacterium]MDQ3417695.1 hypothetical protein [Acidobacteriota bacterium]